MSSPDTPMPSVSAHDSRLKSPQRRRCRAWRHCAVVLGLGVLLSSVAVPTAAAQEPGAPDAELFALQEKLRPYGDRIEGLRPTTPDSGFSGIYNDAEQSSISVYWHGEQPAALSEIVDDARNDNITVTVSPAPFTRDELIAERDHIAEDRVQLGGTTVEVTSVSPKVDGSGLSVTVFPRENPNARIDPLGVEPSLEETVPLDLSVAPPAEGTARYDDTPPHKGGAFIRRDEGGLCSSGFSVRSTRFNTVAMLTAGHCGAGFYRTGTGIYMGGTYANAFDRDAILIRNNNSEPRIHDGVWYGGNARDQFTKPVGGMQGNRPGDWVCTSGAFSGVMCRIRVISTGNTIALTDFGVTYDQVLAEQADNLPAGGNGDSGGPVFNLSANLAVTLPRGIVSAIPNDTQYHRACRGAASSSSRRCSVRIWYPDVTVQINRMRVTSGDNSLVIMN